MIMLNNNLRTFITVAELESLTEAAKKLYVSQPAVSQSIKKLEDELGVRLFIRNKRSKLILTDVGRKVLALAYQMADLENRLYQTAYEENHMMGGMVHIASVPLGVSIILSRVLPVFRKQFPNVSVELLEGNPLEVKNMVANYQADLGISTSPYMDLDHRPLMQDRMVSISRDSSKKIDLKKDSTGLVLCRVAYESVTEQLSGRGIDLSHSLVVEAASTQINMIERGNGSGIISELMLSTIPNELVRGKVSPGMEVEISLLANDFNELSTAAAEMAGMILQRRQL